MPDLHTALEAAITSRLEVARAAEAKSGGWPWMLPAESAGPITQFMRMWSPRKVIMACERDLKVLKRHVPTERPTGTSCAYCESLCHSRSGLGCESPDAPWPCDDYCDVLDVYPEVARTAPSSPLETPQTADGGEAGVVEGAGGSEAAEACPLRERCRSCRCVLDASHGGDHDVHCGNGGGNG